MRDESSTATVGVFFTPVTVLFLVLLGIGVDYVHRHAAEPVSRERR